MDKNKGEGYERIVDVPIEDEMMKSYMDYAVYVITYRALQNVYDGLKPGQRRIFVGFHDLGLTSDKPYKKTVKVVGETMGNYHPHGNEAIYAALVRMAQPWSLRYPLVDGHGNFGSIDGDKPAAMRYTEARLHRVAEHGLLKDLSKDVVDYQPNYDNSLEEPVVLPSLLPMLANGGSGIAVGVAANIAPHNLRELYNGTRAFIDDNDITIEALMEHIKAPDFPTGGIIYGYEGVKKAFLTGKGRIVVRGVAKIEADPKTNKTVIIVTELPYVVKKADLVEKTAHLINNKVINGISSLRDESDRQGLRIVYELKRDATPNVVLNNLYKHTALQSSFNVNNVALVDGVPKLLNLKDFIHYYVVHRHRVVTRRTQAACDKARQQRHLLQGYLVVGEHVNEVVKLIKSSKDGVTAKQRLMEGYGLSEVQAKSVLEMRLQRLTGLERAKITQQYQETERTIENLEGILGDRGKRMEIIKEELGAFAQRYGDDRRTQIVHDAREMVIKDMIPNERMVITLSQQGYIKATPLAIYKSQQRGGVGAKGVSSKKEDVLSQLFVASAHDHLLIFTSFGKVYWQHVYSLPQGGKNARGRAIQNVLEIAPGDEVRSILKVKTLSDPAYVSNLYVTLCTAKGIIKKVRLEAFSRPLRRGIRAISFKEGDRLVEAQLTRPGDHIIMGVKSGKAIRFHQNEVRAMGRTAAGVRGISIDCNDEVIGMLSTSEKSDVTLLVISEKGYGKRSSIETYRITRRGGKGVKTLQVTPKTGTLIAIKAVQKTDELIAMNKSGITLRTNISSLRTAGRNTQGVRVVRLVKQDRIASVAIIKELEEKPDV